PDLSVAKTELVVALRREQLDDLPWAVVKTDPQGVITYSNRGMDDIAGVESLQGRSLAEVFEGENLATVRTKLEHRLRGAAEVYEVDLTRPGDGVRVPIEVSALPETDESGRTIGSLAIVRELLTEDVASAVHRHVEELRCGQEILEAVARETQRLVPFDLLSVTLYSTDGEHFRSFFNYPQGLLPVSLRWWPMTPFGKALVGEKTPIFIDDIEAWLEQPEAAVYKDEPDTQYFLSLGFNAALNLPIVRGDRVVATLGFYRKRERVPFTAQDETRLSNLALSAAVHMALHYEEVNKLDFILKLLRKMASVSDSPAQIADALVHAISEYHLWENIAVLQPDEYGGHFRILAQVSDKPEDRLPEDWRQPIDRGVVGKVYQTGEPLNVMDVTSSEFAEIYLEGNPRTASELCLPILVHGRVYWLLNIEDSKRSAFAAEELLALHNVVNEVQLVLERATQHQINSELLARTRDAVIQTDFGGKIRQVNPATERLLGYAQREMVDRSLAAFFNNPDQARRILESDYVPSDEVKLIHQDGAEVSVLFSGTSLPPEMGIKVFMASDLSTRKRTETLEILRHMYNEIASQIKTPLSLAFTWLERLQQSRDPRSESELVAKVLRQLNRVDLSYDRLLLYEREGQLIPTVKNLFYLPELIQSITKRLPIPEAEKLTIRTDEGLPAVRGDLYQLAFCFESILSYLLRFVPEESKIELSITGDQERIDVVMRGFAPEVTGGEVADYADTRWAIRAITELALGEQIVRRFVEDNHGGAFRKEQQDEGRVEFAISLPVA
ncbi:MAG: PAS domain S-box protein, partial [Thiohalocapsa sp.]